MKGVRWIRQGSLTVSVVALREHSGTLTISGLFRPGSRNLNSFLDFRPSFLFRFGLILGSFTGARTKKNCFCDASAIECASPGDFVNSWHHLCTFLKGLCSFLDVVGYCFWTFWVFFLGVLVTKTHYGEPILNLDSTHEIDAYILLRADRRGMISGVRLFSLSMQMITSRGVM